MHKILIGGLFASVLLACSGSGSGDSASRAAAGGTAGAAPAERTLSIGTTVLATIQDSISSRSSKAGARVNAIVSRNVMDDGGHVVIAGGSTVVLTIARLAPATGTAADGVLALDVTSMTAGGAAYKPGANVSPIPHALLGRAAAPGDRDVVVTPGTPITITLTQPLKISAI
ncbi:MAG: hypothetical protein JWM41_449 [Gemmatimonadetes bacterium]|nr:hypothetical protein [Gemmatimonadota bacterium]